MVQWPTKPAEDVTVTWLGAQLGCDIQTGPWIAGGTPRLLWFAEDQTGHDIDVFFPNIHCLENAHVIMKTITQSTGYQTMNACTYTVVHNGKTIEVQLISKHFYKSLDALFNDFDFTVCKFATDGKILVGDSEGVEHCKNKQLSWNEKSNQTISPYRVIKYSTYGFDIDNHILHSLVKKYNNNPTTFSQDPEYE